MPGWLRSVSRAAAPASPPSATVISRQRRWSWPQRSSTNEGKINTPRRQTPDQLRQISPSLRGRPFPARRTP
jgi:hypothetical protein